MKNRGMDSDYFFSGGAVIQPGSPVAKRPDKTTRGPGLVFDLLVPTWPFAPAVYTWQLPRDRHDERKLARGRLPADDGPRGRWRGQSQWPAGV
jgi:hypothetical protein